jgi:hypothetical protein
MSIRAMDVTMSYFFRMSVSDITDFNAEIECFSG